MNTSSLTRTIKTSKKCVLKTHWIVNLAMAINKCTLILTFGSLSEHFQIQCCFFLKMLSSEPNVTHPAI